MDMVLHDQSTVFWHTGRLLSHACRLYIYARPMHEQTGLYM